MFGPTVQSANSPSDSEVASFLRNLNGKSGHISLNLPQSFGHIQLTNRIERRTMSTTMVIQCFLRGRRQKAKVDSSLGPHPASSIVPKIDHIPFDWTAVVSMRGSNSNGKWLSPRVASWISRSRLGFGEYRSVSSPRPVCRSVLRRDSVTDAFDVFGFGLKPIGFHHSHVAFSARFPSDRLLASATGLSARLKDQPVATAVQFGCRNRRSWQCLISPAENSHSTRQRGSGFRPHVAAP